MIEIVLRILVGLAILGFVVYRAVIHGRREYQRGYDAAIVKYYRCGQESERRRILNSLAVVDITTEHGEKIYGTMGLS